MLRISRAPPPTCTITSAIENGKTENSNDIVLAILQKQVDLPFACNSSRDLQPPIDSGRALSLLSDTLSSSICIGQTQNGGKLLITTPHIS